MRSCFLGRKQASVQDDLFWLLLLFGYRKKSNKHFKIIKLKIFEGKINFFGFPPPAQSINQIAMKFRKKKFLDFIETKSQSSMGPKRLKNLFFFYHLKNFHGICLIFFSKKIFCLFSIIMYGNGWWRFTCDKQIRIRMKFFFIFSNYSQWYLRQQSEAIFIEIIRADPYVYCLA